MRTAAGTIGVSFIGGFITVGDTLTVRLGVTDFLTGLATVCLSCAAVAVLLPIGITLEFCTCAACVSRTVGFVGSVEVVLAVGFVRGLVTPCLAASIAIAFAAPGGSAGAFTAGCGTLAATGVED